jgi:Raf kinase inhibitor-like YbhB/YbcL family protein
VLAAVRPAALALVVVVAGSVVACGSSNTSAQGVQVASPGSIQLTSPDFVTGGTMPTSATCSGADGAPQLMWSGGPQAQEYGLTLIDHDAPGGRFVHWVVWGIPGSEQGVAPGALPMGAVEGKNDFGSGGYRGPCPPTGEAPHRYVFTIYALSQSRTKDLHAGATIDEFFQAINGFVLASGTLTGTLGR